MLLKTNLHKHKGGEKQRQMGEPLKLNHNKYNLDTLIYHPSGPLEDDDEGIVWV